MKALRSAGWTAGLPLLLGLLPAACQGQRPPAPEWLGTRYPPAPEGVVIERGTTLGTADTATFALAEVATDGGRLVWLARRVEGAGDRALWTVVDALEVPDLGGERWLMLAVCGRLAEGAPPEPESLSPDPGIVAIARAGEDPVLTGIESAWRASGPEEEIEPIPTAGVACLNDMVPEP